MNAMSDRKSVDNNQQGEWEVTVRHGFCSKNLDRLKKWADWSLMNAKKRKGKVLHMTERSVPAVMQAGAG